LRPVKGGLPATRRAATSDKVKDLRQETQVLKEVVAGLTLENRQVDNLIADSLWDAVPDPIRPRGAIREGFWSAALIAIIPAAERRSGNAELA
jgi:hypothetical protein